jgi:hypothetical protein
MSGSSIQLANATFINGLKASLTCPDRTGLIGEYLLRENVTRSIRNIANIAVPASFIGAGTPVYNANSILLSGSATYGNGITGMSTGLLLPVDMTLILVRKKVIIGAPGGVVIFGGKSTLNNGFMEYSGYNFYNNQSGTPPGISAVTPPTDLDFHFIAGTGANADKGTMYVATSGVMNSIQGTTNGIIKTGSDTIKLCGTAGNYQIEVAYAAIYNRVLAANEVNACYNTIKAFFAMRDVLIS